MFTCNTKLLTLSILVLNHKHRYLESVILQVMAPLPVAEGEVPHCPLDVDSLCGSYAVICGYKELTNGVSITSWRARVRFSTII